MSLLVAQPNASLLNKHINLFKQSQTFEVFTVMFYQFNSYFLKSIDFFLIIEPKSFECSSVCTNYFGAIILVCTHLFFFCHSFILETTSYSSFGATSIKINAQNTSFLLKTLFYKTH